MLQTVQPAFPAQVQQIKRPYVGMFHTLLFPIQLILIPPVVEFSHSLILKNFFLPKCQLFIWSSENRSYPLITSVCRLHGLVSGSEMQLAVKRVCLPANFHCVFGCLWLVTKTGDQKRNYFNISVTTTQQSIIMCSHICV